jgi:hypothetical protein
VKPPIDTLLRYIEDMFTLINKEVRIILKKEYEMLQKFTLMNFTARIEGPGLSWQVLTVRQV